ncbi:hypothetical protein [Paenibacillus humicola]|uniref:hypothetical protein n=1 Tax=Paenibacillus humicola TaxID=3110540 RepID=UPI00237C22BD|nr:hypothetical protein [Paenibacillus humicola]
MAFGIDRQELQQWKRNVLKGEIAFLTHYWLDPRFADCKTVTKVGCADLARLSAWCEKHGLEPRYIHRRDRYPHFDLIGRKQTEVLIREGQWDQLRRFGLGDRREQAQERTRPLPSPAAMSGGSAG